MSAAGLIWQNVNLSEELSAAAGGYLAYSGPFSVDEEKRTLRHHIAVSLFPNWLGDIQVRRVQLEGIS